MQAYKKPISKRALTFFTVMHLVLSSRSFAYYEQPLANTNEHAPEATCAIIKSDAVTNKHVGEIISIIERNKFDIRRVKKMQLCRRQAEEFYAEHEEKPFFDALVTYMSSGPIIVLILEQINAIALWRQLIGATDPLKANVGTIRKMFGINGTCNAVHGSDSRSSAERELAFFFYAWHRKKVGP